MEGDGSQSGSGSDAPGQGSGPWGPWGSGPGPWGPTGGAWPGWVGPTPPWGPAMQGWGAPPSGSQGRMQGQGWGWQAPMQGWGWQAPTQQPGGDNVYRPTYDFSTQASGTSTPAGSQGWDLGNEEFTFRDLGIYTDDEATPPQTEGAGRGRGKKGKRKAVVGEASGAGAGDADDGPRRKWTEAENVALAKAWVSVCDDPLCSNKQRILNMWSKVATAYARFCPQGKAFTGEECRKTWGRIRHAVGRFCGLHQNALRQLRSGQTEEDAYKMAVAQFPLPRMYREWTYRACWEVLKESETFRAGVEAEWPRRQRLNYQGEYSSSSAGSHDLPPDVPEFPSPSDFPRRQRPVGQRRAQRAGRVGARESPEIQSASPQPAPELLIYTREKTRQNMVATLREWKAATDPEEKEVLWLVLQSQKADLRASLPGSEAAGSGNGGGEDDDGEAEGGAGGGEERDEE